MHNTAIEMRRTTPSGRTAPFNRMNRGRLFGRFRFRTGYFKTAQNFVRGILQPRIRLVKLTGSLAGQRTKLVAIGHMRKCFKNEIGTHHLSPSSSNSCTGMSRDPPAQQREANQTKYKIQGCPKLQLPFLRRTSPAHSSKTFGPLHTVKWMPYRIGSAVCAPDIRTPIWPFPALLKKRSQGIKRAFSKV